MSKINYSKPVLSIKEQITLLKDRGLYIKDEECASNILKNTNYYRLSAYTHSHLK